MEPLRTCPGPGGFCHFRARIPRELHMGVAQLEERRSPKPKVAGSTPAARADPDLRASGRSLRTPQRTMRDRVEHRPTEVPSGTASARAPACPLPTGDPGRGASARPRRQRRRASRCGVSASIPALGAGGRGSTPCISTLAPSSSMVERTPDTRPVGDRRLRILQRREGRPDPGRVGPQAALDAGPADRARRGPGTRLARPLAGGLTYADVAQT